MELMVNWSDKFDRFINIDKFLAIDRLSTKILCSEGQLAKIKRCVTLSGTMTLFPATRTLYFHVLVRFD